MINCEHCLDTGVVQGSFHKHGKDNSLLVQCQKCKNIKAYSEQIKALYGQKETPQEKINRLLGRNNT